jgi:hypothetical protein
MSPHRVTPSPDQRQDVARRGHRRVPARRLAALVVAAGVTALAPRAHALELRLTTGNDLLTGSSTKDDLYTFAVGLELERGDYTVALRENAFTDRQAGLRFDETYLTLGRFLPGLRAWSVYAEAGVVHVGHGLFGASAQNTVHRFIGDDEVELPYDGASTHARLGLTAERAFALAGNLEVGPRFEVDTVPGLRSHAVLAAQARWRPRAAVAVDLLLGGRFTDASFASLEPHLATSAPTARVGVVLKDRISLAWTYNDYGDEREHLSVGYRIAAGRRGSTPPRRTDRPRGSGILVRPQE